MDVYNFLADQLWGLSSVITPDIFAKIFLMIHYVFPLTLVLSGLMAGIHFANVMGYLPALATVKAEHMVPFWKKADQYFSQRMPIFGISLLICVVMSVYLLRKKTHNLCFWLIAAGFVMILVDLIITIRMNTPVNKILRALIGSSVPENFDGLRSRAIVAFYGRAIASILSFVLIVSAYLSWSATN